MNKKYELTDETIGVGGCKLYRIRALRDFGNVKAGDLGGFIESEENLSYESDCWVGENARVYENAWISENARVFGNACVYEDAQVSEMSKIFGNARVFGNAWVLGTAKIFGDAWMFGDALAYGDMKLDSGMWNQTIEVDDRYYLISTTLKKILMEW